VLRIHVVPALGKMALDEIVAEHIIALIARMRSRTAMRLVPRTAS
jgi:hypothetical protein